MDNLGKRTDIYSAILPLTQKIISNSVNNPVQLESNVGNSEQDPEQPNKIGGMLDLILNLAAMAKREENTMDENLLHQIEPKDIPESSKKIKVVKSKVLSEKEKIILDKKKTEEERARIIAEIDERNLESIVGFTSTLNRSKLRSNKCIITGCKNKLTGHYNNISGDGNTIHGSFNRINGNKNKIYGNDNKISGNCNKAYGLRNEMIGENCQNELEEKFWEKCCTIV